jgi:UDP-N-acetyl-2-amino-2-deoxyglucuronate dehydrogenase
MSLTGGFLHLGLVGGGGISDTHARAALEVDGVRVAAVQGVNRQKVDALAARSGATPYSDVDALLAHRPLDFVAIGSPSALHAAQGIAAARAGMHVLVEKPIDVTTRRADALVAAADAAGVRLGVFFQDRFKPGTRRLKALVEEGVLGRPIMADARVPWYRPPAYYAESRWRGTPMLDGGGALINQAIHTVDLLLWLLGDIARVHARTATTLHAIAVEDSGAAILEFASGVLGVLAFTTAAYPGYPRRVSVTGTRGTALLEHDDVVSVDVMGGKAPDHPQGPGAGPQRPPGSFEAAASPIVSDVGPHRAVIEDFVGAIREGRSPRCDGRQGRRSVAVIEAVYRASREGRAVDVELA